MTRFFSSVLVASGVLAICGVSAAQGSAPTQAGISGWFELNSYHNTSSPEDGFFLERGQVLDHLQFGFGAVFQADNDPLTWQGDDGGEWEQNEVEIERQLAFHLSTALGLWDVVQLGVQLPIYIDKGKTSGTPGGIGDIRILPKFAWRWDLEKVDVGVSATLPISFPSGSQTSFLGEGQVVFAPRLALDLEWGRFRLIGNGGALVKEGEARYGLPRGKELFGGIGGNLAFEQKTGVLNILAELMVTTQAKDFFSHQSTPVELLGGFRYAFNNGVSLLGAVGTSLTGAATSPDVRMLLGMGIVTTSPEERREREEKDKKDRKDWAPIDTDGDSFKDYEDFCIEEAEDFDGFEDDDGCPEEDNDKDGVPDRRDRCPMVAEVADGINDGDGCPETDTDKDGLPDGVDKCPKRPEDKDGFEDDDGCPDLDDDGDAVPDKMDQCLSLPESVGTGAVYDGCPDSFKVEGDRLVLTARFEFAKRKTKINAWGRWILSDLARALKANPDWREVHITVHTSGKGNAKRNQKLSEDRAMLLMKTLVDFGVEPDRLIAEGRGDSVPMSSPKTAEGREENERVELIIVEKGGAK